MTMASTTGRAFFKNLSVGGGGGGASTKKGPYYTECGEMIDGLLVTKSWCGIAFNSGGGGVWRYSHPENFYILLSL